MSSDPHENSTDLFSVVGHAYHDCGGVPDSTLRAVSPSIVTLVRGMINDHDAFVESVVRAVRSEPPVDRDAVITSIGKLYVARELVGDTDGVIAGLLKSLMVTPPGV